MRAATEGDRAPLSGARQIIRASMYDRDLLCANALLFFVTVSSFGAPTIEHSTSMGGMHSCECGRAGGGNTEVELGRMHSRIDCRSAQRGDGLSAAGVMMTCSLGAGCGGVLMSTPSEMTVWQQDAHFMLSSFTHSIRVHMHRRVAHVKAHHTTLFSIIKIEH